MQTSPGHVRTCTFSYLILSPFLRPQHSLHHSYLYFLLSVSDVKSPIFFSHSICNESASISVPPSKMYPNPAGYRLISPLTAATLTQTTATSQQLPNYYFPYVSPHSKLSILNTDLLSLIYSSKTLVSPYCQVLSQSKSHCPYITIFPYCLSDLICSTCSPCPIQSRSLKTLSSQGLCVFSTLCLNYSSPRCPHEFLSCFLQFSVFKLSLRPSLTTPYKMKTSSHIAHISILSTN